MLELARRLKRGRLRGRKGYADEEGEERSKGKTQLYYSLCRRVNKPTVAALLKSVASRGNVITWCSRRIMYVHRNSFGTLSSVQLS